MKWDSSSGVLVDPAFLMSSFFFNDTATTEIYTLSLHDALPISPHSACTGAPDAASSRTSASSGALAASAATDRKSTRLNSSHPSISYAVFCLKKKKENTISTNPIRSLHQRTGPDHLRPGHPYAL